jgi:tRNA threonylcarbamoyladenosine modification (KEOPS) complex  Pcc1 subunit
VLSASITLDLDTDAQADALEASLRPELGDEVPGSTAILRREGRTLLLEVHAEDAGAMRAALNSYLRWADTALRVHAVALGP